MSTIKIHSPRVILIEGNADELVSNAESAAGMHGFAILVPPGEEHEWLLDMLWRITIAYAGRPSLLMSRAMVRKMVEAVMSKESRETKPARRPARKSGLAERAQPGRPAPSKVLLSPVPAPTAKPRAIGKAEPLPVRGARGKASARKTK
jgi:hypothetical protein